MLTNPEPTKTVSEEEVEKITLAQKRLLFVQDEVLKATVQLDALEKHILSVNNDREYAENRLKEVTDKVAASENQVQVLDRQITNGRTELDKITTAIAEYTTQHASLSNELSARENAVALREETAMRLEEKQKDFAEKLKADRMQVAEAQEAFKVAISKVVWK